MPLDFQRHSEEYYLHHRASKLGYLRQAIDADHGIVTSYNGRFGRGYTVEYHSPAPGRNYHYIEYWVEKR